MTGYLFQVKGNGSHVVPTTDTTGVYHIANSGQVSMYNDAIHGNVFSFSGSNYLSISAVTPVSCTKTFWLSSSDSSYGGGNVFSSSYYPVWFNMGTKLNSFSDFRIGGKLSICNVNQGVAWTFYAVTVNATSNYIYINGNPTPCGSGVSQFSGDTAAIQFGAWVGGDNYFGLIDDMRLYPSVMTAAQILAIYNGTFTLTTLFLNFMRKKMFTTQHYFFIITFQQITWLSM